MGNERYIVLGAFTIESLMQLVNDAMKFDNYVPVGGVSAAPKINDLHEDNGKRFIQAMIKKDVI